ncbi:DUF2971 domain-containing protein [Aeromonas hydrophila]|uniref:DUF2971 domain-containing protein n=2 Tax=Aeromonas hydrophila TaxID=644 RepID=UPI000A8E96B2|nr:DUF2971 domain-containing protein [Aeromonas hydrophila]EJN6956381.1 DUF2971 domain-containing protein [Aeromonas hydrophila]TNI68405.1 hypothetical protein CF124_02695 [Aeromonas hydrophila]CAD7539736.1 hypothetical protein KBAH04_24090 [Aeromonas hydrophila]HAU4877782.1 DUF2971 domain-containing protein [Aeromonas hydrophila]HAU4921410.1 DUF2971 domain-containing protein [Aeromonas hydrophila]
MRTFYKYYSHLPEEYLLNPTIKLTPPSLLNDPFEYIVPEDIINYINNDKELKKITHEYMEMWGYSRQELTDHIIRCLSHCGIVSLSETPRNLLMWAHYGAQHKGICIGYKETFFDNHIKNNEADWEDEIPYFYRPEKINYDSTRLVPNETKIMRYDGKSIIYNIISHILTIKSDEWIYEKEHRCIVPIYWGDSFTTSRPYFKPREAENGVIKLNKNEYIHYIGKMFKLEDGNRDYHKFLAPERTSIFKSISSQDISSIYFGCKSDTRYVHKIINLITGNPQKLGHIKAYIFKPSSSRFELEIESCLSE